MNIWPIIEHITASRCPLCHTPTDGLCRRCSDALPRNRRACRGCAEPLPAQAPDAALCGACQAARPAFDSVLAPLLYQPPVDDLVARFKYHDRLDLGRLLAAELRDAAGAVSEPPQLLLPVPMDSDGLQRRGFNQAAELARWLSSELAIPWSAGLLQRSRPAAHQRGLDRRQRRANLRRAFDCGGRPPRHVAVIDDVVTTGATADAVARALKRAGAERVDVWAVARTPARRRGV